MGLSVARKLLESHLVEGELVPWREIAIRIDQTLTQDATGTLVMLEVETVAPCHVPPRLDTTLLRSSVRR
jgi:aconitate hydratase